MHLDPVTIKPMNVPYSLASSYYYMVAGWVGLHGWWVGGWVGMCVLHTPQGNLRKVKVKTIVYLCFYNLSYF